MSSEMWTTSKKVSKFIKNFVSAKILSAGYLGKAIITNRFMATNLAAQKLKLMHTNNISLQYQREVLTPKNPLNYALGRKG